MVLQPRDVIRVWDRQTRPSKLKRSICIFPERQLFLRINSKAIFRPHHLLLAKTCDFLEHDSYVELQQLVRHYAMDIQNAEHLGRLNDTEAHRLCLAVQASVALSPEHKELICEKLGYPIG